MYLDSKRYFLAFLNKTAEEKSPNTYITKDDAIGAAARMHGYAARLGLGSTRIKNHSNDPNPITGKNNLFIICFILHLYPFIIIYFILNMN